MVFTLFLFTPQSFIYLPNGSLLLSYFHIHYDVVQNGCIFVLIIHTLLCSVSFIISRQKLVRLYNHMITWVCHSNGSFEPKAVFGSVHNYMALLLIFCKPFKLAFIEEKQ